MTDDVTAYQSLAETLDGDEDRWAFGSAGAGPAATASDVQVTAPAPVGVDASDVATYCLMLADDALVASQRLAEWTTNAPELEEEVALANCALDLLGQARVLLSRAGHLGAAEAYRRGDGPEDRDTERSGAGPEDRDTERSGAGPEDRDTERSGAGPEDEDLLTFFRDERAFRHVTLAEVDPGDFGRTVAWMLLFSSWRLALMAALRASADPVLAAVAAKAVPELTYHRDYAAQWMLRLGDGTEESHRRVQAGLDAVWPHVEELFGLHEVEGRLLDAGVAVDPTTLRADVDAVLDAVLPRATLTRPERPAVGLIAGKGGRDGIHTEVFGPVLAQMQSLARAHPGGDLVSPASTVWEAAAGVVDPEMPMLTLADLGVLRRAELDDAGVVRVAITPTYTGCPAMDAMRADLDARLRAAGYDAVDVRVTWSPPWSTDLITDEGRRKLAEHGLAPPARVGPRAVGPVPLTLTPPTTVVACPRCGSPETELVSRFGPTACTALRRCRACAEPFEHVKELA